jgi:hypothetical protein
MRPSPEGLREFLEQIEFFVARLRADAPALLQRDREVRADGYPSRSGLGAGGNGGHGVPTETVALALWADARARAGLGQRGAEEDLDRQLAGDPVHDAVRAIWVATMRARDLMREADSRMRRALPPEEPEAATIERGVPACVSHARFNMYEPQHKRGRCRWCYDWCRANGTLDDPPEGEIRAREERRVYGRSSA